MKKSYSFKTSHIKKDMDPNFLSFGQKYIVMKITWFKFQDLQGKWSFQRHHKIWFKHLKTTI